MKISSRVGRSDRSKRRERVEHRLLLQDLGQQRGAPCPAGTARRPARRCGQVPRAPRVIVGSRRVQSARTSATLLRANAARTSSRVEHEPLVDLAGDAPRGGEIDEHRPARAASSATRAGVNGCQPRRPTATRPSAAAAALRAVGARRAATRRRPRRQSAASPAIAPRPRAAARTMRHAHSAKPMHEQRERAGAAPHRCRAARPAPTRARSTVA